VLWSVLVVLSYAAYQSADYQENYFLLGLEYVLLYAWFGIELLRHYRKKMPLIRLQ
jgi:hypothetical protein